MIITKEIKTCYDCEFVDHTGAFTKGGAKPCCRHPETIANRGDNCFKRVIPYDTSESYRGRMEEHTVKKIPSWCPYKKGV